VATILVLLGIGNSCLLIGKNRADARFELD
jgi:hypothetical protein